MSRKNIYLSFFLLTILLLIYWIISYSLKPKIVFVNRNIVYKDFALTKEILKENQILKKELISKRDYLFLNKNKISNVYESINSLNLEINQLNAGLTPSNYTTIAKRLNVILKEYAVKNNFQAVLFFDDFEDVNYVSGDYDVTKKFLVYANNRFEGFKE